MPKDFEITITDPTRRAEFIQVLGRDTVAVRSFIPETVRLDGLSEPKSVYILDVKELTQEELNNLVLHISLKLNAEIEVVRAYIQEKGLAILASDCLISVKNPMRWLDFEAPDAEEDAEDFWGEDPDDAA